MARWSRLLLLARSYARACASKGQHIDSGVPVPGRQKAGDNIKGRTNHETIRFQASIEKKLNEQDLKLVELERNLNVLEGRVAGEAKLYKQKEEKDAKALKCAMDEVKFSFVKGAGAFVGLSAAVASIVANLSKITEWFRGSA